MEFLRSSRGLRQRHPLSPYMFILVTKAFIWMVEKETDEVRIIFNDFSAFLFSVLKTLNPMIFNDFHYKKLFLKATFKNTFSETTFKSLTPKHTPYFGS